MKNEHLREKEYIKSLALLYIHIAEMKELSEKAIQDINKPLSCYLVNKDIIDEYQKNYYFKIISQQIDNLRTKDESFNFENFNQNNNILDNFINNIDIEINKIEIDKNFLSMIPLLLETETSKIYEYEFPNNFFILRKEILDILLNNNDNKINNNNNNNNNINNNNNKDDKNINNNDDNNINNNNNENNQDYNFNKEYKLIIGKEGFFIWNLIKQKENIKIFYLKDLNSGIDKIFLFKEEQDFLKELKSNIIGKTNEEYYSFRNIIFKKAGYYNIIDDGEIIGKYITIIRNQNYKEKDEDKEQFDNLIIDTEKNFSKMKEFLKNLLINLYSIRDLREICLNILNEKNRDKKDSKKNNLIDAFSEFVKEFSENPGKDIEEKIINFYKIFFGKNLGESIVFNEEHVNHAYEHLIKKVIECFEIEIKYKNRENGLLNNIQNKIFDIFYGEKKDIDNMFFNTLYINPKKFRKKLNINENNEKKTNNSLNEIKENNQNEIISLNEIINLLTLEEYHINKFPEKLILILDNFNNTFNKNNITINVPLDLKICKEQIYNEKYILLSCIQNDDNSLEKFCTIVKKEEKLFKINYFNNSYQETEILDKNELSKSFVFFYERLKESEYSSGSGNIHNINIISSTSTFDSNSNITNKEDYINNEKQINKI